MDKKNIILGILFIGAAIALMFYGQQQENERLRYLQEQRERERAAAAERAANEDEPDVADAIRPEILPTPAEALPPEEFYTLENEYLTATFTTRGAAVDQVALKKYRAEKDLEDPYVFNGGVEEPALSLRERRSDEIVPLAEAYELVERNSTSLTFRAVTPENLEITRTYTLGEFLGEDGEGAAPYLIEAETVLRPVGEQPIGIDSLFLSVGTAAPIEGDPNNWFLNVGYSDGDDYEHNSVTDFTGSSGFLGLFGNSPQAFIVDPGPVNWGFVKNQFFTAILSPTEPASSLRSNAVLLPRSEGSAARPVGVTGSLVFEGSILRPGETRTITASWFVGPKELDRLDDLAAGQDKIMQYPPVIGGLSKLFLAALQWINSWAFNFGLAIVILTLIIRTLFFPLTAKAAKNARLMQTRLSEPMKAMNEKYAEKLEKATSLQAKQKINEQKQKEMLELYKKAGVNPLAGCLPILIQMPVFLGFFYMLRAASELRFEGFLWINDLSQPDTIFSILGLPINPMPIIMTVSMVIQMKVASPPTMDKTQKMIMQFMPLLMLLFLYNFSSGLALYWTTSNIFTIFQQLVINRQLEKNPETARVVVEEPKAKKKARTTAKKPAGFRR